MTGEFFFRKSSYFICGRGRTHGWSRQTEPLGFDSPHVHRYKNSIEQKGYDWLTRTAFCGKFTFDGTSQSSQHKKLIRENGWVFV